MINPRLDLLPDYPFQRLRDLLNPLTAPAGVDPVLMSLGEPQHEYPDLVAKVLAENAHLYGKYPPAKGSPALRQAIVDWLGRRYGLKPDTVDPERHVSALSGTREGLFMCAFLAVPPSKAGAQPLVLMPNPFYQCYGGAAIASGAQPVYLPVTKETNFLPDLDAIPAKTWERTALFYLCSPSNPQGTIADLAYIERLIALARTYDFVVVFDECYAEIYTDQPPPGALQVCEAQGSLDNVLCFHSLSKRSSVPGLRAGFVVGDPDLIRLFLRLREYGGNPIPLPLDAAAAALWNDEAHVAPNRARYVAKFDEAERIFGNRLGFYRPGGGFFLWLDVGDGEAATVKLWTEAAIRVLPGAYLAVGEAGQENPGARYIRIALVYDEDTTAKALRRMAEVL
ncbi:MAG: aminotransferase class I/II-fold pyridoxal phosphate-dependent enzyme [Alphaproteobacteria bacterium]